MPRSDPRAGQFGARPDPAAIGEMARNAIAKGEERLVLPAVTRAAEAWGRDATLWQWKGLLHRALNEHEEAMVALNRAARFAPGNARLEHARARVALEAGRPATALFEQARKLAPQDGEVILGLAAARAAAGRRDEAIEALASMVSTNPGWLAGHEALARLRWEQGERAGFARSLEEAIARMPGELALWRGLVILLVHAEFWGETLSVIARGRAALGGQLFLDANEAITRSGQGDLAAADILFAKVAGKEDAGLAAHRMRHELRAGRPEIAARLGDSWVKGAGADLLWPYMGIAWRLLGDPRLEWLEGDPRLVSVIDLDIPPDALARLAKVLRGLHNARSQGLDQSVRGGTQTDGALFSRTEPEIAALRAHIVAAVQSHVAQLPPVDPAHPALMHRRDRDVRFAGSWSVRLSGQGHHANHIHPMGWISSAFYVSLPETGMGGADHDGWLSLGMPQAELGLDLPPTRLIEPKPGRLALFPSTMWHGTMPFAEGERLTVAFDIARPIR